MKIINVLILNIFNINLKSCKIKLYSINPKNKIYFYLLCYMMSFNLSFSNQIIKKCLFLSPSIETKKQQICFQKQNAGRLFKISSI